VNSILAPVDKEEDFRQAFFRAAILVQRTTRLEAQMANRKDDSVENLPVGRIEWAVYEYGTVVRRSL
jgi:hypothetical protein